MATCYYTAAAQQKRNVRGVLQCMRMSPLRAHHSDECAEYFSNSFLSMFTLPPQRKKKKTSTENSIRLDVHCCVQHLNTRTHSPHLYANVGVRCRHAFLDQFYWIYWNGTCITSIYFCRICWCKMEWMTCRCSGWRRTIFPNKNDQIDAETTSILWLNEVTKPFSAVTLRRECLEFHIMYSIRYEFAARNKLTLNVVSYDTRYCLNRLTDGFSHVLLTGMQSISLAATANRLPLVQSWPRGGRQKLKRVREDGWSVNAEQ